MILRDESNRSTNARKATRWTMHRNRSPVTAISTERSGGQPCTQIHKHPRVQVHPRHPMAQDSHQTTPNLSMNAKPYHQTAKCAQSRIQQHTIWQRAKASLYPDKTTTRCKHKTRIKTRPNSKTTTSTRSTEATGRNKTDITHRLVRSTMPRRKHAHDYNFPV
jgi:hypothetical protein